MNVFFRLTKVDLEKHEVWGRATQEVVDKSREIFDYESSKPYFQAWSDEVSRDSGGKSLGNIRAMHGKTVAGKVIDLEFNDTEKAIDIGTKIVDVNEWQKVEEGCYTGFSIGGGYVKKWPDTEVAGATRFTAEPSEISIVDRPCVPTAKFFSVIKANGVTEQRPFKETPVEKIEEVRAELKKWAGEEISDVLTAARALSDIFYLYCKEGQEPGEPPDQVPALKLVVENLKRFIASEIMEDSTDPGVFAMAQAIEGLSKVQKIEDLQAIKSRIETAWLKKVDPEVPPSAEKPITKEAAMTAQQELAKAAKKTLDEVQDHLKKVVDDHLEAVGKFGDNHDDHVSKLKKCVKALKGIAQGADEDGKDDAEKMAKGVKALEAVRDDIKKTMKDHKDAADALDKHEDDHASGLRKCCKELSANTGLPADGEGENGTGTPSANGKEKDGEGEAEKFAKALDTKNEELTKAQGDLAKAQEDLKKFQDELTKAQAEITELKKARVMSPAEVAFCAAHAEEITKQKDATPVPGTPATKAAITDPFAMSKSLNAQGIKITYAS